MRRAEAPQQLVHQAGFARPPGAGNAQHQRPRLPRPRRKRRAQRLRALRPGALQAGDHPRHFKRVLRRKLRRLHLRRLRGPGRPAFLDNHADHAFEAQLAAICRAENARHPGGVQRLNFCGHNGAAAAPINAHMARAALAQPLHQVAEELHVPALVGGNGDGLGVLLDGGFRNLLHRAVVAQVDHLCALGLQNAAHDVDGRIVAVKQRRRRNHAHRRRGRRSAQRRGLFRLHHSGQRCFSHSHLPGAGTPPPLPTTPAGRFQSRAALCRAQAKI